MIFRSASLKWRAVMNQIEARFFWPLIWLLATLVWFMPGGLKASLAGGLWLSALLLAPHKSYGRKLLYAASFFLIFWSATSLVLNFINPGHRASALNLAIWLALGLNLMLAKTPLSLALALADLLRPLTGRRRSRKLALVLALMLHLLPGLLSEAAALKDTVAKRAEGLSFHARAVLWGRAVSRAAFGRTEELSRALLKRWPWD